MMGCFVKSQVKVEKHQLVVEYAKTGLSNDQQGLKEFYVYNTKYLIGHKTIDNNHLRVRRLLVD